MKDKREQEIIELGVILNNKELADYLYNTGYRKQSEVAKEIFDNILNFVIQKYDGDRNVVDVVYVDRIKQLAKEYGVQI